MNVTLDQSWTYRTPLLTIEYPAGTHDMPDDHAAAALAANVIKEKRNGNRSGQTVPPSGADSPES